MAVVTGLRMVRARLEATATKRTLALAVVAFIALPGTLTGLFSAAVLAYTAPNRLLEVATLPRVVAGLGLLTAVLFVVYLHQR